MAPVDVTRRRDLETKLQRGERENPHALLGLEAVVESMDRLRHLPSILCGSGFQQGDKNIAGLMGHMNEGPAHPDHRMGDLCERRRRRGDRGQGEGGPETVAKARELGASVTNEPMDMPIGRFAGLIDPQGASFTVMQPAPPA